MNTVTLSNPDRVERWDIDRLRDLGCWLEGIKLGSGGSLHPLGTSTIDSLWKVIRTMNGILADDKINALVNPKGELDSTPQKPKKRRKEPKRAQNKTIANDFSPTN